MAYYVRRGRRVSLRGLGDDSRCVQPGQRLLYKVSWPPSGPVISTASDILQKVITAITSNGEFRVVGSDATSSFYSNSPGFALTVLDMVGHGDCDDVRKIIDTQVYNQGRQPMSTIAVIASLPADTITPPKPPTDLGQWLSDNWIWIALGLGAAVVAEDVL